MDITSVIEDPSRVNVISNVKKYGINFFFKKLEFENQGFRIFTNKIDNNQFLLLSYPKECDPLVTEEAKRYGFSLNYDNHHKLWFVSGDYTGKDPEMELKRILSKELDLIRKDCTEKAVYHVGTSKEIDAWLNQMAFVKGLSPVQAFLLSKENQTISTHRLLASSREEPFGVCTFVKDEKSFMNAFYIHPLCRKWGLGTKFLKKSLYYAISQDIDPIHINVLCPVFAHMLASLPDDLKKRVAVNYSVTEEMNFTKREQEFFDMLEPVDTKVDFSVPENPFQ